jgi:hypothetical protein
MKKLLFAAVFLAPTILLAQSGFDGVWRMNLQNTQYVGKENYSLQNGVFRCSTCDPKIDTKADGQDHSVSGSPYFDAVNVRVVDDRTVEIVYKKKAKVSGTSKLSASPDGKTLATEFANVTEGGQTVNGKYTAARLAAAPGSAHKISGVWQPGKLDDISENVMEVTYKGDGDGLSMSDKAGNSYTAKFDGKDYPYKGDPGITTVALQKIDARIIEETYKRDGKTVGVSRKTVAPDGKTMSVSFEDKVRSVTIKWTADKR